MPGVAVAGQPEGIGTLVQKQAELLVAARSVSDPARIHSRADLRISMAPYHSLLETSRQLAGKLKQQQELLPEKLLAASRANDGAEAAIRQLIEQDRRYTRLIGKVNADAEWAETMLHRFRLMKEHWGVWQISGDGEAVVSDNPEFFEAFELLTRRANAIRSLDALSLSLPECRDSDER